MMKKMKISEFAKKLGVKPETIRFWERIGVMPEAERMKVDPGLGYPYRYYTDDDLKTGFFILNCKRVGFTLKEIKEFLMLRDYESPKKCEIVASRIYRHIEKVREKREFLMAVENALIKILKSCNLQIRKNGKKSGKGKAKSNANSKTFCPIIRYLETENFILLDGRKQQKNKGKRREKFSDVRKYGSGKEV